MVSVQYSEFQVSKRNWSEIIELWFLKQPDDESTRFFCASSSVTIHNTEYLKCCHSKVRSSSHGWELCCSLFVELKTNVEIHTVGPIFYFSKTVVSYAHMLGKFFPMGRAGRAL